MASPGYYHLTLVVILLNDKIEYMALKKYEDKPHEYSSYGAWGSYMPLTGGEYHIWSTGAFRPSSDGRMVLICGKKEPFTAVDYLFGGFSSYEALDYRGTADIPPYFYYTPEVVSEWMKLINETASTSRK